MEDWEMIEWFTDAAGFITWCIENGKKPEYIVANLAHDINGIAREEDCFAPRLNGYAKYWRG